MKRYGRYKVILPDEEHVWEPDNWLGSTWNQVETDLSLPFPRFIQAVDDRQFLPCQWLIWYLRRQDGLEQDRLSVDFHLTLLKLVPMPDPEATAADTPPSESNGESDSLSDSGSASETSTT